LTTLAMLVVTLAGIERSLVIITPNFSKFQRVAIIVRRMKAAMSRSDYAGEVKAELPCYLFKTAQR